LKLENINNEMVEIEELDETDKLFLATALKNFIEETDSEIAKNIVSANEYSRFSKVMPREYKRVLLAQAKAIKDGTDPLKAVMEAYRG